ncbi:thiosulfate sulfurtransferase/rhodanese-like domain-containing protein 3 isoform 2-T2 [Pangshura tecta]
MWGCRGLSCAARVLLGVPRAAGSWTSGRRPLQPVNVIFRNLDTAADCSLSYKELKGLLKSQTTLIDVREKWEIGQFGKIPGSVNIPCVRSKKALDIAKSLGFSRVQHYAGGLEEWSKYESPEKKQ